MKKVDTFEYFSILREMTEQGSEVQVWISGSSMLPFLADQRDFIYFKKPDRLLKRRDIVAYQRASGQFVVHRIYKTKPKVFISLAMRKEKLKAHCQKRKFSALSQKYSGKEHGLEQETSGGNSLRTSGFD